MGVPAHPQWIEKMYPNTTGRDHLGLGNVSSDLILLSLAPGINVLTIHPRYHSFYTFLLDEFWRRDLPRTRELRRVLSTARICLLGRLPSLRPP